MVFHIGFEKTHNPITLLHISAASFNIERFIPICVPLYVQNVYVFIVK
jgi:hypothetical protein